MPKDYLLTEDELLRLSPEVRANYIQSLPEEDKKGYDLKLLGFDSPSTTPASIPDYLKEKTPEEIILPPQVVGVDLGYGDTELDRFKKSLDEQALAAWEAQKEKALQAGSTPFEAESKASAIVSGILLSPRELASLSPQDYETPAAKEEFYSGDTSFLEKAYEAFSPQPLETPYEKAYREKVASLGERDLRIINEEVEQNLAKWKEGQSKSAQSYWVEMKDPTSGGIDESKVEAWKEKERERLIYEREGDIRTEALRLLLEGEAAKGVDVAVGSEAYKKAKEQATQIGESWVAQTYPKMWEGRVAPRSLETPAQEMLQDILTTEKEGRLYESIPGTIARDVGGLIRPLTSAMKEGLTYEVDEKGNPVNPEDWNYQIAQHIDQTLKESPNNYLMAVPALAAAPRKSEEGPRQELSSGNFMNDTLYAIAVGRSLGDDMMELPATKAWADSIGYPNLPFYLGIGGEILLPVSPLTAVSDVLALGGRGARALREIESLSKIARPLEVTEDIFKGAAKVVAQPVSTSMSYFGNNILAIRTYDALAEAYNIPKLSVGEKVKGLFYSPTVPEALSSVMAPAIAEKAIAESFSVKDFPEASDIMNSAVVTNKIVDGFLTAIKGEDLGAWIDSPLITGGGEIVNKVKSLIPAIAKESGLTEELVNKAFEVLSNPTREALSELASSIRAEGLDRKMIDIIESSKAQIISAVTKDELLKTFAESTYNDWVMITPITVMNRSSYEKWGKDILSETKKVLFGNLSDSSIAKLISEGKDIVIPQEAIATIKQKLSDYAGRTVSSNRVRSLISKISSGKISISDWNEISDFVKSQVAFEKLGSKVIEISKTGQLTQKAAIPLVRRLTGARAFEDMSRAVSGKILSNGLKIYSDIRESTFPILKGLTQQIPRLNIELYNKIKELSNQIAGLPEAELKSIRAKIMAGENGAQILSDYLDEFVNAKRILDNGEEAYLSLEQYRDMATSLIRKYFSIPEESVALSRISIGTAIDNVLTKGIGLDAGLSYRITKDSFKDIISEMKRIYPQLEKKGLKKALSLSEDEGISSLLIAKSLDGKRLSMIDEFGKYLVATNPEFSAININTKFIDSIKDDTLRAISNSNREYNKIKTLSEQEVLNYFDGDSDAAFNAIVGGIVTDSVIKKISSQTYITDISDAILEQSIRQIIMNGEINTLQIRNIIEDKISSIVSKEQILSDIKGTLKSSRSELLSGKFSNVINISDDNLLRAISLIISDTLPTMTNNTALDILTKMNSVSGIPIRIASDVSFGDVIPVVQKIGEAKILLDSQTAKIVESMLSGNKYLSSGLDNLALNNKDISSWLGGQIINMIDYSRGRMVSGMLGGIVSPNLRFFGANNFTAPLIAAVTTPTYVDAAIRALPKSFVTPISEAYKASGGARTFGTGALSGAVIGGLSGGPGGALIGAAIGGIGLPLISKAVSSLGGSFSSLSLIVTPSGKIINDSELSKILGRTSWRQSQISFEFRDSLLSELNNAIESGIARSKFGYSKEVLSQALGTITTLSSDKNFWNIVASESDIVFRKEVFKEALRRGLTEEEASNLSRSVLFDYSKISDFEKDYISRFLLFYAFARGATVETIDAFAKNPFDNAILKKVKLSHYAYQNLIDNNLYPDEYTRSRVWNSISKDEEGFVSVLFGPQDPMLDRFNVILGAFAAINSANYTKSISEGILTGRPELALAYNLATADNYGFFPSSNLEAAQSIGAFPWMIDKFDLVAVSNEELEKMKKTYGGIPPWLESMPKYNGSWWKFSTVEGKRDYLLWEYASVSMGFNRTMRDWILTIQKDYNIKNPEIKRGNDGSPYLYAVGLETPLKVPDWIEVQFNLVKKKKEELNAAEKGKEQ